MHDFPYPDCSIESHQTRREYDRFFHRKGAVDQHYEAMHNFRCPDCNRKFFSEESLYRYQKSIRQTYRLPLPKMALTLTCSCLRLLGSFKKLRITCELRLNIFHFSQMNNLFTI